MRTPSTPVFAAVALSVLGAVLLWLTNGNLVVVPALCVGLLVLWLFVRHLDLALYCLLAATMVLDQFRVFGFLDAVTTKVPFYLNLNTSTGIGPLVFNPVELLLVIMVAAWFWRATISREWHLHSIPNAGMAVVFLLMLIFFTGYGLARGGDWKAALWEIRALYYLCFVYFIASQIIRTRRQVQICVWIIIAGVAVKGFQGCWRYFVTKGGDLGSLRAILGHEDSLFIVTVFVLLAAYYFLGYRGREFKFLVATLPMNLLTFIFNQRRITYGVLGLSLGIVVAMLPKEQLRKALRVVIPFALLFAVYTAAFWNKSGGIAMPAQKVKSMFVKQEGTADNESNEWRKLELINLKATIRAYPLGIGFGNQYLIVVPYADIGDCFPLWRWIPHCALFWVWIKTGFVGFTIFWLFFGTSVVQAMIDYRAMRDPYFKALALMIILFIVGQVIIAYYDLQITFYRNMIYLGTAMALGSSIRRIEAAEAAAPPAPARPAA
jgi:hypothetical protein